MVDRKKGGERKQKVSVKGLEQVIHSGRKTVVKSVSEVSLSLTHDYVILCTTSNDRRREQRRFTCMG